MTETVCRYCYRRPAASSHLGSFATMPICPACAAELRAFNQES